MATIYPDEPQQSFPTRVWKHKANAQGFVSTNLDSLTLKFASTSGHVEFTGRAKGSFGPSLWEFEDAKYFYDEHLTQDMPVYMEVKSLPQHQQVIVAFFPEVQPEKRAISELMIPNAGLRLPPQGARGDGTLVMIYFNQ